MAEVEVQQKQLVGTVADIAIFCSAVDTQDFVLIIICESQRRDTVNIAIAYGGNRTNDHFCNVARFINLCHVNDSFFACV